MSPRDEIEQNETPSPRQSRVISSLLAGANIAEAAELGRVSRGTVYRWLKQDPVFLAELNRGRQGQIEAARAELRALATQAVQTLREIMAGAEVPPGVRFKAAVRVLEAAGATKAETMGPTDPEEIQRDWERDRLLKSMANSFSG